MHAVAEILSAGSGAALECTQAAHDAFNAELGPILKRTVFQASPVLLAALFSSPPFLAALLSSPPFLLLLLISRCDSVVVVSG